jgi:DNA-binding transcriptional regulator YiaG
LTIKQLRKALGMSAREFGVSCGLTGENIPRTVYRWEAGDQEPNGASRMLIEQLRAKLERTRKRKPV